MPPVSQPESVFCAGRFVTTQGSRRLTQYFHVADAHDVARLPGVSDVTFALAAGPLTQEFNPVLRTASGEQVHILPIANNFFRFFGIPIKGPGLDQDVAAGQIPIVLSAALASRHYGDSAAVLGSDLAIENVRFTVAGVVQGRFAGLQHGASYDAWILMKDLPRVRHLPDEALHIAPIRLYARGQNAAALRTGSTQATAPTDESLVFSPLRDNLYPHQLAAQRATDRDFLLLLVAGSIFLCVSGCSHLLGIVHARFLDRRVEFAVRIACGATIGHLLRAVLRDSIVLGLCAMLVAISTVVVILRFVPDLWLPSGLSFADVIGQAWVLVAGVGIGSMVLASLIPMYSAWRFRTHPLSSILHGYRPAPVAGRGRSIAMLATVAASFALVVCALLTAKSAASALREDLGFDVDNLIALSVQPGAGTYDTRSDAWRMTLRRIRDLPGVTRTAKGPMPLFKPVLAGLTAIHTNAPSGPIEGQIVQVGTDYFSTAGIHTLAGRTFTAGEVSADRPQVAIVSASFAARAWPSGSPLGRSVFAARFKTLEVIGVVADSVRYGIRGIAQPTVYVPLTTDLENRRIIFEAVVRTSVPPTHLTAEILRTMRAGLPSAANLSVQAASQEIADQSRGTRLLRAVFTFFAVAAVGVCLLSIYATVHLASIQNRRSAAIHIAIGASRLQVFTRTVSGAVLQCVLGCLAGLLIVFSGRQLLATFLFGVNAMDPLTLAVGISSIGAIAFLAAAMGARHLLTLDAWSLIRDS
jgi:ABC-type antimicrobial peptide transport system permease subunit